MSKFADAKIILNLLKKMGASADELVLKGKAPSEGLRELMEQAGVAGEKLGSSKYGRTSVPSKLGKTSESVGGPVGGVPAKLAGDDKRIMGSTFPGGSKELCVGADLKTFPCNSCLGHHGRFESCASDALSEVFGVKTNENQVRQYLASLQPDYSAQVAKQILGKRLPPDLYRSNIIGELSRQKQIDDVADLAEQFPTIDWYTYNKSYRSGDLDFGRWTDPKNTNIGFAQSMGAKPHRYDKLNPDLPIVIAKPPGRKSTKGYLDASDSDVPTTIAAVSKTPQRIELKPKWYKPEDTAQMNEDWDMLHDLDSASGWNAKDAKDQLLESWRRKEIAKKQAVEKMRDNIQPGSVLDKFLRKYDKK